MVHRAGALMVALLPIDITKAAPMRSHVCAECGAPFLAHATLAKHAEFCGTECRKTFNNRRAMRGAVLFDLFMTLRYERKVAGKLNVWRMICRQAMDWRSEDKAEREGRKSWRNARAVLEERPYLNAISVSDKTWRRPS